MTTRSDSQPAAHVVRWPFIITVLASAQFVVLTTVAMFFYAGGTAADPAARGYQFFRNFFSDLGMTVSRRGAPNTVSAVLFFVALTVAGLGLVAFFAALPRLFRGNRPAHGLSLAGSAVGVLSGLAYAGIAFTPANLNLLAHALFVEIAFVSFFVAVLFLIPAIALTDGYPKRYAWVFVVFAVILAGYLVLLFSGLSLQQDSGLVAQATGQKIIVYAMIVTALIEAEGARRQVGRPEKRVS